MNPTGRAVYYVLSAVGIGVTVVLAGAAGLTGPQQSAVALGMALGVVAVDVLGQRVENAQQDDRDEQPPQPPRW